jgi:hypothetical protein
MWHTLGVSPVRQCVLILSAAIAAGAVASAQALSFRETCERATAMESASPRDAEALLLAAALRDPLLALRETRQFLTLSFGPRVLERLALSAPDEAMSVASGGSPTALALRHALFDGSEELRLLASLAQNSTLDLPSRGRVAVLAGPIARRQLSMDAAIKLSRATPQYFAQLVDLRKNAGGDEGTALRRALEAESLALCREAQESPARTLNGDLARFRAVDLYLLLAYGRAETAGPVFPAIFDRLLLPKWRAEKPAGASLSALLNASGDWKLRDFVAAALDAHRFEEFLSIAGAAPVSQLVRSIDQSADPLADAIGLAEMIAGTNSAELLHRMALIVPAESARCVSAGDKRGELLYGLIAARLIQANAQAPGLTETGGGYLAALASSDELDMAALFGPANRCIERHFFWDDDDGMESFASFRAAYAHDPAWAFEDHGVYVHLTGLGAAGRTIEIFANVPIDAHLPANRARENESMIRQQAITAALAERGLTAPILVHRGHSFHVEKTLTFVDPSARLVILGSCRGAEEIRQVLQLSHQSQVIATRGVGATGINDVLLKSLNDRLLNAGTSLAWSDFWRQEQTKFGRSALFQRYFAPNQDPAAVFLRAYYKWSDTR